MEKVSELESVKVELESFLESSKNEKTKDILSLQIKEVAKLIEKLTEMNISAPKTKEQGPRKIVVGINQHAFDESDKFIKLYFPFDAAATLKDEDVQLNVDDSSFTLLIETPARNYKFTATSLLHKIEIEKCYKKIKPNDGMVAVLLKKAKEGITWKFLTTTEKALKDKMLDKDGDELAKNDDPNGALMNIMKKMYDSGDSEMKRTIAKAWTEGQEKNKANPAF